MSYPIGTPPYSTTFNGIGDSGLITTLQLLPDNTSNQISPSDVRNSVYTLYLNTIIRYIDTNNGNYIGMSDMSEISGKKFYIGKKSINGLNIMNSILTNYVSNNTDIFFHTNNPNDNNSTKISILSGSNTLLFQNAPYIQSEYVIGQTSNYIDFNIINSSTLDNIEGGNIQIRSDYGNVIINNMKFPKLNELSNATNKFLKYLPGGVLVWDSPAVDTVNNLGSVGATVSITGDVIYLNGQNINFDNNTPVPVQVGGVLPGTTFSNVPVTEVLNMILYPYLEPIVDFGIIFSPSNPSSGTNDAVVEVVSNVNLLSLSYYCNIYKRTNDIQTVSIPGLPNISPPPYLGDINEIVSFTTISINPTTSGIVNYNISVSDGESIVNESLTITKVYPYFYGVSTTATDNPTTISNLLSTFTKIVKKESDTEVVIDTNFDNTNTPRCIYFMFPAIYSPLDDDPNNLGISYISLGETPAYQNFEFYPSVQLNTSNWTNIPYHIYIYSVDGVPSTTNISAIFKFKP